MVLIIVITLAYLLTTEAVKKGFLSTTGGGLETVGLLFGF
jgi:hypothetical protein